MDATTQDQIVQTLQKYNVDLNFAGHWHYYERYMVCFFLNYILKCCKRFLIHIFIFSFFLPFFVVL
jgi:hypothetical protein